MINTHLLGMAGIEKIRATFPDTSFPSYAYPIAEFNDDSIQGAHIRHTHGTVRSHAIHIKGYCKGTILCGMIKLSKEDALWITNQGAFSLCPHLFFPVMRCILWYEPELLKRPQLTSAKEIPKPALQKPLSALSFVLEWSQVPR